MTRCQRQQQLHCRTVCVDGVRCASQTRVTLRQWMANIVRGRWVSRLMSPASPGAASHRQTWLCGGVAKASWQACLASSDMAGAHRGLSPIVLPECRAGVYLQAKTSRAGSSCASCKPVQKQGGSWSSTTPPLVKKLESTRSLSIGLWMGSSYMRGAKESRSSKWWGFGP